MPCPHLAHGRLQWELGHLPPQLSEKTLLIQGAQVVQLQYTMYIGGSVEEEQDS